MTRVLSVMVRSFLLLFLPDSCHPVPGPLCSRDNLLRQVRFFEQLVSLHTSGYVVLLGHPQVG